MNLAASSAARIGAMTLRYAYLLRSSWPRMLELIYWPAVQLLTWGFMQTYLAKAGAWTAPAGAAVAAGAFVGAVLLWDILLRGQQGFSFSFLEEMWSRNVANLFMSPLRPFELVAAMMLMSLMRVTIGVVPVTLLAIWFFGFNLWALGFALAAFFAVLMIFAWGVGLFVCGVILRYGLGAENLVWSLIFVVQPLGCVYYPVAILPPWLQAVCWALPPTYVFEGLRALLIERVFRADLMLEGLAVDALVFSGAVLAFVKLLASARRAGSLLQTGE